MEILPQRHFKTAEWILAKEQILDAKGQVYLEEGQEARITAYYPEKYPTPYATRRDGDYTNGPWLSESVFNKHPGKAHLIPQG